MSDTLTAVTSVSCKTEAVCITLTLTGRGLLDEVHSLCRR